MKLAYYRGVLSSKVVSSTSIRYSMISIGLSPANANSQILELERAQPQRFKSMVITISCINSPSNVTVPGPIDQLSYLSIHLQKLAYHSSQMEVIASESEIDRIGASAATPAWQLPKMYTTRSRAIE